MKKVLVLCTGNSCRSIMAEALINQLAGGTYTAQSAGSRPAGYVHPLAIATLKHHGIEAVAARSKSWDELATQPFDTVITVCDQAANESCPIFPGKPLKLNWSIPDPAKASGSDEEITQAFYNAYQLLKSRIEKELL
tara:strand:+ start:10154 stop:10564 length:411 start_codon:yes stop_codon:yes gene_type:complete